MHRAADIVRCERHCHAPSHKCRVRAHSLQGAARLQRRARGGVQKLVGPTPTSAGKERGYTVRRRIALHAPAQRLMPHATALPTKSIGGLPSLSTWRGLSPCKRIAAACVSKRTSCGCAMLPCAPPCHAAAAAAPLRHSAPPSFPSTTGPNLYRITVNKLFRGPPGDTTM